MRRRMRCSRAALRNAPAIARLWVRMPTVWNFFIDGRNARTFASQGQQRSIALAWKIAEVELVKKMLGVKPVLLLDDVMSELDTRRRSALVDLLHEDIQTFMTATDLTCFEDDIVDRASVLDLSKAGVRA